MKRVLTIVLFSVLFGGLASGLMFRDKLTNYLSSTVVPKVNIKSADPIAAFIDSAYNYNVNAQPYRLTWLEFGSTHCRECIVMEEVMRKVRDKFRDEVKVVFWNVSLKESKPMVRHFGIFMIPVQVILDQNGRECYRHIGGLSFQEISKQLYKYGMGKEQIQ